MGRLDVSGVRQVPLHTDDNVFKTGEKDGGRNIVRGAPFEQNRRVGSELRV